MCALGSAKMRIEIFQQAPFFDDHFQTGWVSYIATADSGDELVMTKTTTDVQSALRDLPAAWHARTEHRYCVVRVTEVSGPLTYWQVWLDFNGYWVAGGSQHTDLGIEVIDIGAITDVEYNQVLIRVAGGVGAQIKVDYIAICDGHQVVSEEDIIGRVTVTRPVLAKGVAGAQFTLFNEGGTYNDLVKNKGVVLIWLSRDEADLGTVPHKIFGGRIIAPASKGLSYGDHEIAVECQGHAFELNVPPANLHRVCKAENGRLILEAALALCAYITRHPDNTQWFDAGGSSGSTDDRIDSTHDICFEEVKPGKVFQDCLEKAKNPASVQGFDIYETPAGCLVGHLKNSLDFTHGGSLSPGQYRRTPDTLPIINLQTVYGAFGGVYPTSGYWSDNLSWWRVDTGSITVVDGVIVCTSSGYICDFGREVRPFNHLNGNKNSVPLSIESIHFKFLRTAGIGNPYLKVTLECPDASNAYSLTYNDYTPGVERNITLFTAVADAVLYGPWEITGTPDWRNIKRIRFYTGGTVDHESKIWELRVNGIRWMGTAEDVASQATYGTVEGEPEIDDALQTAAECQLKAESIIALKKDPAVTYEDVVADGDETLLPSYRKQMILANEAISEYCRIVQVVHSVESNIWNSILTLTNDPQNIDFIFRSLREQAHLMSRRV